MQSRNRRSVTLAVDFRDIADRPTGSHQHIVWLGRRDLCVNQGALQVPFQVAHLLAGRRIALDEFVRHAQRT